MKLERQTQHIIQIIRDNQNCWEVTEYNGHFTVNWFKRLSNDAQAILEMAGFKIKPEYTDDEDMGILFQYKIWKV